MFALQSCSNRLPSIKYSDLIKSKRILSNSNQTVYCTYKTYNIFYIHNLPSNLDNDCDGEPSFLCWLAHWLLSVCNEIQLFIRCSDGLQDGKSSPGSRYQNYTRKLPQTKTPLLSLSLQGCKLLQLIIKKFLLLFNYRAARHM